MANTQITFDVNRREVNEPRFTLYRKSADIKSPAWKNNVYQWPGTGTYTLQPINLTTDFSETNHWEAVKYRLADCTCMPGWFVEVPDNVKTGIGPCDYFIHGIVKNTNYTLGKNAFHNLIGVQAQIGINAINFEQRDVVTAVVSKNAQAANQGYCLRFRFDGRPSWRRAALFEFSFGQFMVRFNSVGTAELWQSGDFVNYALVYSFQWSNVDQIHGRSHQVVIFPHCRNRIEFVCSTGEGVGDKYVNPYGPSNPITYAGTPGNGIYEIPGKLSFQADGKTPLITMSAPWSMAVSREFRPVFQVSKILFANGTNASGYFWDTPADITSRTGVIFPPTIPLYTTAEFDQNGVSGIYVLANAETHEVPFKSDGKSQQVQFGFAMQGKGDIPGPGLGSTVTPEFYGYAIDKAPGFFTYDAPTYTCPGTLFKLDHGKHAEEERSSITTYDMGAYMRFSERGDIPIEIGDADSGLLYFEGTVHMIKAGEAPAHTPIGLHMEARGMVDNFLRMDWTDSPPDFEKDPYDAEQRPYLFSEMIKVCFETAGFDRSEVVIEEEELYLKNFRVWSKEEAHDDREGGIGSGHKTGTTKQSPWQPLGGHKLHEFTDHVIRDVLGWNWVRDRSDRKWHIYKRPDPSVASDTHKYEPKVEFYSDGHPQTRTDLPGYKHSNLEKELKRPVCSTIVVSAAMDISDIEDAADMVNAIITIGLTGNLDNPENPDFAGGTKKIYQSLTNPLGYKNPKNPNPDTNHPDYLRRNITRTHYFNKAQSRAGLAWLCRRLFEDNCFGYLQRTFEADWGDIHTYNLRKWDVVLLNGENHYIERIEPNWSDKKFRRAHYTVIKVRTDVRAPR